MRHQAKHRRPQRAHPQIRRREHEHGQPHARRADRRRHAAPTRGGRAQLEPARRTAEAAHHCEGRIRTLGEQGGRESARRIAGADRQRGRTARTGLHGYESAGQRCARLTHRRHERGDQRDAARLRIRRLRGPHLRRRPKQADHPAAARRAQAGGCAGHVLRAGPVCLRQQHTTAREYGRAGQRNRLAAGSR